MKKLYFYDHFRLYVESREEVVREDINTTKDSQRLSEEVAGAFGDV